MGSIRGTTTSWNRHCQRAFNGLLKISTREASTISAGNLFQHVAPLLVDLENMTAKPRADGGSNYREGRVLFCTYARVKHWRLMSTLVEPIGELYPIKWRPRAQWQATYFGAFVIE